MAILVGWVKALPNPTYDMGKIAKWQMFLKYVVSLHHYINHFQIDLAKTAN
jgi:hypothetical protein